MVRPQWGSFPSTIKSFNTTVNGKSRTYFIRVNEIVNGFDGHLKCKFVWLVCTFFLNNIVRSKNWVVIAFHNDHWDSYLYGDWFCFDLKQICILLKRLCQKCFPCIMNNYVWRVNVDVYPTQAEGFPDICSTYRQKSTRCSVSCSLVNDMQDCFPVNPEELCVDSSAELFIIAKGKF